MPYTFFGLTGSKTMIDHFIVTVNISQDVSKYYALDLIENISDHMPLYGGIDNHTPMIYSTVDTCITPRVRALWSGASVDDITKYKQYVDLYLDNIYVPVDSLLCKDYNCDNSYHCDELRSCFFVHLIECIISATKKRNHFLIILLNQSECQAGTLICQLHVKNLYFCMVYGYSVVNLRQGM